MVMKDDFLGRVMDKYTYMKGEVAKAKKKSVQEEEAALYESLEESTNHGIMKSQAKVVSKPTLAMTT